MFWYCSVGFCRFWYCSVGFGRSYTLKSDYLVIGFVDGQSTLSFEVSDVLLLVLEKPGDSFICSPGRTHNRIRSPRLVASGQ